jgi:hypothetical protein
MSKKETITAEVEMKVLKWHGRIMQMEDGWPKRIYTWMLCVELYLHSQYVFMA